MNVTRNPVPHFQNTPGRGTPHAPAVGHARYISLVDGALGEALLNVELALTGFASWDEVTHAYDPRSVTARELRGDGALPEGLFYGAPAAAFVFDAADVDGSARYANVLVDLDKVVKTLAAARLTAIKERKAAGFAPLIDEVNLFNGLIGFGVLLLRRAPRSRTLGRVVAHVVDLTRDLSLDGVRVPGWWANPRLFAPHEGYAELGMEQGAAGSLAFLASAVRAGHGDLVPKSAFDSLVGWLDAWKQDGPDGPWWPYRLSLDELRTGRSIQATPSAPTWVGTVGIARALQMAAIVAGESAWRETAEQAMASALSPQSLGRLTDPGLVTGTAGVYQTAFRAVQDAASPLLRQRLTVAAEALARTGRGWAEDTALLTGRTGTRLANQTLLRRWEPVCGWDRCLGIAWADS